ncbi:MAG TPA: ABC transporter substrate-binding protein [Chloroflexota bacterium]|nr:ABC transporter substrate-binding protein [Chloroflexota bacterium]
MRRTLGSLSIPLALFLSACGGSSSAPSTALASAPAASAQPPKPAVASSAPARAATSEQPLAQLTIPYTAVSVSNTPIWVPIEAGLFKKYGIDARTEFVSQSPNVTAAMLSGQTPVANQGEDSVINADLEGGDIAIVASGMDKFLFSVFSSPKLATVADLKGKKIGISKIGSTTDFVARLVLSKNNLQPEKDVALIQLGGVPEIMAGIQSGAVDAGMLSPPTDAKARQAGLKELVNLTKYDVTYYQAPLAITKSWLTGHHDQALNVLRGYAAGVALTHRDKEQTKAIIAKYTKTDDQAVLEDAYQALVLALPQVPTPKADAIQTGLAQSTAPKAQAADPNSFIDPSLVDELQKSGFIDSLYR